MPKASKLDLSPVTKTHPVVAIYILVAAGMIIGTAALFVYIFTIKK